jgi:hypothetical protein
MIIFPLLLLAVVGGGVFAVNRFQYLGFVKTAVLTSLFGDQADATAPTTKADDEHNNKENGSEGWKQRLLSLVDLDGATIKLKIVVSAFQVISSEVSASLKCLLVCNNSL